MRRQRSAARGGHVERARRRLREKRILHHLLELTRSTVLYDPDCGLCRTILAAILAWDRHERLRPLALGTPEADRLLAGMPECRRWGSWHIVEPDGSVSSAGRGFTPLLRMLPGGRPLAAVAERSPAGAERAYRLVAGNRSRLGRLLPRALKQRADERIERRAG